MTIWKDGVVGDDYESRARAVWDAYARGGIEAMRELLDDDVELRPSGGEVLHGPDEIAGYLERQGDSVSAIPHVYERRGDCVLVHGSLRRFHDGGFLDVQPSWVCFFRAGKLLGATAYASRAEALGAIEDFGPKARP
jgi:ketosteroid isomerase-like protein